MSKNRGFEEVPHTSRTDWVTVQDAARVLGLREDQVYGFAKNGHVVCCRAGRRRLVSLEQCREHARTSTLQEKYERGRRSTDAPRTREPIKGAADRLISYAEASKIAGRSRQTIQRWVRQGRLKKHEGAWARTGGCRIAMVSHAALALLLAELAAGDTAKASQPEPIRCEVVPIQVNGAELAGIRLDGQEVIAAQLLEKILGLQPKSLSTRVGRDEWFVEGEDYIVLKGRVMGSIRQKAVAVSSTASLLRTASHLMVLTESGVVKVLTSIRSRVTDILATTLLRSNFMRRAARAVMQGDQEAFAWNMTDDATDALAQCRAQLAQQQATIDSMGRQLLELGSRVSVTEQDTARHGLTLDRVSTILEHLVKGSSRPEPTNQNSSDFVCTMTATEVVKHLSRMVKEPLSEKKVHQMARKIEVREHGGQYYGTGLRGHSERCRINGSYYIWHYSPAMIALIKNYITGGQRDMWDD